MKVKELINLLEQYDPEMDIYYEYENCYETCLIGIDTISEVFACFKEWGDDYSEDYYPTMEEVPSLRVGREYKKCLAFTDEQMKKINN